MKLISLFLILTLLLGALPALAEEEMKSVPGAEFALKLFVQQACAKAHHPPRQHLKRRPRALPKIEVGQHS